MKYLFVIVSSIVLVVVAVSCGGGDSTDKDVASSKVEAPARNILSVVEQGDTAAVRQHINAGTDPNEYEKPVGFTMQNLRKSGITGVYPIHLAVIKDNQEVLQVLIDGGANLNVKSNDEHGFTALHWAAYYCLNDMASLLMDLGATVNVLDTNNATPVDVAVAGEEIGLARLMEEQNSNNYTYTTDAGELVPGCSVKSEDAQEAKKQLDDLLVILETHGGKASKDL